MALHKKILKVLALIGLTKIIGLIKKRYKRRR